MLDLIESRERYGLELVDLARGRLKRGSVYVTLGRMESKGFVTSRQEDRVPGAIGLPRRLYRATPYGLKGATPIICCARRWRSSRRRPGVPGDRIAAVSSRFLREETFDLIVHPRLPTCIRSRVEPAAAAPELHRGVARVLRRLYQDVAWTLRRRLRTRPAACRCSRAS